MPEPPTGRRRQVLTMLRESTLPLSIAQIAERLGMHPNTVRFHLDALAAAGRVERAHASPAGPGRPALVFQARRGMDPTGPRNYRLLAQMLASGLAADADPATRAIEVGRAWGRHLVDPPDRSHGRNEHQAVGRLMALLDDLGFAPEQPSAGRIGLRHCPFLELAEIQGPVVCPLHLGLMQGAMTTLGTSVTVERLDPFVEPDLCVAHLSASTNAS